MIESLHAQGFTHVSIDMARGVSVTAWRGTERKTYSVYGKATAEDAFAALQAQIDADDFEDIL